jgi:glucan phosphoethanolaminetransferase (alkaline phosphatase superfamily)
MRYTDFVLSKIIDIVDETHSIASLVYSSDHGETLFDGSCGRSGHGSSGRQEFPVSAMAWVSSSHKSYWPEKSAALASNSPRRITTENVFPSVVNLAGISSDQFDEARSLSSPKFQLQRRLVNASGLIDWDTATAKGPCNLLVSH